MLSLSTLAMYSNVEMFVHSAKNINFTGTHAQLRNNWFYFPEELLAK